MKIFPCIFLCLMIVFAAAPMAKAEEALPKPAMKFFSLPKRAHSGIKAAKFYKVRPAEQQSMAASSHAKQEFSPVAGDDAHKLLLYVYDEMR